MLLVYFGSGIGKRKVDVFFIFQIVCKIDFNILATVFYYIIKKVIKDILSSFIKAIINEELDVSMADFLDYILIQMEV